MLTQWAPPDVMRMLVPMADPPNIEIYWFGSRIVESILLLLIGAVVGLVGQLIIDYFRRPVAEDFELWVDVHHASQKAEGIGRLKTNLSIRSGDREVQDPYVVDFYVWGVGKKDIRSEQFDGSSLKFNLNVPIISELQGSTQGNVESARFSFNEGGVVSLAPSLVRSRVAKRYRFLTDGKPRLEVTNPVADLKVYNLDEQWEKPSKDRVIAKWLARTMLVLTVLVFLAAIVFSIVRAINDGPQPPTFVRSDEIGLVGFTDEELARLPWWIYLTPLWIMAMGAAFAYGAAPSRRPKRAAQLRYENLEPSGAPPLKTQRDYLNELNAPAD